MTTAVFPGSFDPPTYGHLNIIERASRLFDKIDVLISVNPDKKCLFTDMERHDLLVRLTESYKNVTVHIWNFLVADYCRKSGANVLIRGVRNAMDFSHEFDLSLMNKHLNRGVETLLIPTDQKYFLVRSSSIKEVARFGGDISTMVPKIVELEMKKKFFGQNFVSK